MMGPHFICLGAQKAGTRWVYDQFAAHHDFWRPPIKELTYFDKGGSAANRQRAERRLAWRMKKQAKGAKLYDTEIAFLRKFLAISVGEAPLDLGPYRALFDGLPTRGFDCTPGYSRLGQQSVCAMVEGLPNTRFFLVVRDPVDRLWSQAQMHSRLSRQDYDPTESLTNLKRFAARDSVQRFSFLAQTLHLWQQIAGSRFGVFCFDDLQSDPSRFRRKLARFLDVDPRGFDAAAEHNRKSARPGRGPMPAPIREWMAHYFSQEYKELADMNLPGANQWCAENQKVLAQVA